MFLFIFILHSTLAQRPLPPGYTAPGNDPLGVSISSDKFFSALY